MSIEELGKEFMELFKKNNCNVGDSILPQWVRDFKLGLNPEEQHLFPGIVQDLKDRGFFTSGAVLGGEKYSLKQAGYDFIYKN